ncbi:MAG: aminotransferase class V-fold PLP-dependent enzyme [Chitinophagaceae bacterium]|nr:aminotransferase class V-fold PLP-dependent enzyme [Chitinophagaceae bacterium]
MQNDEIVEKLNELNKTSSLLDIPETERKGMIQKVSDFANRFISGLSTVRGFFDKDAGPVGIDNQPHQLSEIIDLYQREVAGTGINAAAGTHLGYIPGGGVFTAALADFMAAVTNPYAGVYYASPGAVAIENEAINWLKSVFSYPKSSVGNLTSGGSVSTLIAFTAARDKHQVKNERIPKHVVYLSDQVHHSTQKALRIIGLEDVVIRHVALDDYFRMKPDSLESIIQKDIAEGLIPFLVVATAGTTDTGAVDPLNEIADVAEKYKMWFHVDAAYGGFFILTSKKDLFAGIERTDSIIVDPHKSMFLPYGLGAVLIKDKKAALHSNHYETNYMQDAAGDDLVKSPSNLSPELTRHFRGLRLWLPLQIHGIEPFITCLEEKLLLVKYFRNRLADLGFCLGPEPDLSVSYFWYPFETDADEKNKKLMDEIHADGDVFLSSSIINNRFVIRIAILSFRTKKEIVDRAVAMIERCLAKVK